MGDGAGGYVVKGARQPTLSHRRGDVRQRRGDRRHRHARFFAAGLHGFPHFLEEGRGPVVNNVGHCKRKKRK
jgi:hypothetical protein